MWWQFKRHKLAMASSVVLLIVALVGVFCEFIAPFAPDAFSPRYTYAPPQPLHLFDRDAAGDLIWRPHVNGYKVTIDPQALRRTFVIDETVKYPVGFFVKSNPYPMWGGLFTLETKLFGPLQKTDPVYLLGADRLGRDMLSRIVYGTRISMSIGLIGVTLSLALGIVLGGISGYKGGTIDNIIQRVIEFILSLPTTPLWLGLAAAMPTNWPPLRDLSRHYNHSVADRLDESRQGDTWPLSIAPHRGFRHCRPARRGQRAAHHLPAHGAVVHQPYHRRGQSCHSDNDLGRDRAEFSRLGIAAAHRELGRIASGSPEHPRDLNRSLALCARYRRGYYRARLEFRRRWIARRSRPLQPMSA